MEVLDPGHEYGLRQLDEWIPETYTTLDRAARRHGRQRPSPSIISTIEHAPTCAKCNHIGSKGECRAG